MANLTNFSVPTDPLYNIKKPIFNQKPGTVNALGANANWKVPPPASTNAPSKSDGSAMQFVVQQAVQQAQQQHGDKMPGTLAGRVSGFPATDSGGLISPGSSVPTPPSRPSNADLGLGQQAASYGTQGYTGTGHVSGPTVARDPGLGQQQPALTGTKDPLSHYQSPDTATGPHEALNPAAGQPYGDVSGFGAQMGIAASKGEYGLSANDPNAGPNRAEFGPPNQSPGLESQAAGAPAAGVPAPAASEGDRMPDGSFHEGNPGPAAADGSWGGPATQYAGALADHFGPLTPNAFSTNPTNSIEGSAVAGWDNSRSVEPGPAAHVASEYGDSQTGGSPADAAAMAASTAGAQAGQKAESAMSGEAMNPGSQFGSNSPAPQSGSFTASPQAPQSGVAGDKSVYGGTAPTGNYTGIAAYSGTPDSQSAPAAAAPESSQMGTAAHASQYGDGMGNPSPSETGAKSSMRATDNPGGESMQGQTSYGANAPAESMSQGGSWGNAHDSMASGPSWGGGSGLGQTDSSGNASSQGGGDGAGDGSGGDSGGGGGP